MMMTQRTSSFWTVTVLTGLAAVILTSCQQSSRPLASDAPDAASESTTDASFGPAVTARPVAKEGSPDPEPPETATKTEVLAYYFHRTMRCHTCLTIERQAHEAIEGGYLDELNAGRLEWHAVNIEEPGNQHFETDFELEASSLVIVEMAGDEIVRWKNLPRVWELVDEPSRFQEYVNKELSEFLQP